MASGTIVGSTPAATGGRTGTHKALRAFESEAGHLSFQIFAAAAGTADFFGGPDDQGFKIVPAILTDIFIDRHKTAPF
jgi:hypothetical protein